VLAGMRNPRFFWFYFVNEHFLRFIGKRYPADYNKLPGWLYWTLHLVWLFPWSLYLPVAVKRMLRDRATRPRKHLDFAARTRLLCAIWAVVLLVFFAFSTNQEYYTFPAYFPILLLIGMGVAAEEEAGGRRWLAWSAGVLAAVTLVASGVLIAGLWSSRHLPFVSDIGTVLAQTNLEDNTLSMGHVLSLTGRSFAALRLPAIIAAIALTAGPLLAFVLRLRRRQLAGTFVTATAIAVLLVAAHLALLRFDPYLSSKRLAQTIARESQPGDRVMIYGDQAFGSSLLFYLKRPIELVNGRTTSMWFGSTYPDAPKIFLDDDALRNAWESHTRVFLFVPPHENARVNNAIQQPKFIVAESSGKVVYSNRP
jgi:hypothetical protein